MQSAKEKTNKFIQPTGDPISSTASKLDGFIARVTDKGSNVKMRIATELESRQFMTWFGNWKKYPNETGIEPGYANPNLPPKNAAHKDVKYWYKFVNEIVFDGVPFTVKFTIRNKGKEQYQYLIVFKENKTPGLSNTVVPRPISLVL